MWAEAEHEYKYELKLKKNYLEMLTCWAMGKSLTRLQKFISENLDFFFLMLQFWLLMKFKRIEIEQFSWDSQSITKLGDFPWNKHDLFLW